jgi:putative ATP-dependent endonuclease of the OLD family
VQIVRLLIENFRGVKSAELRFDGHTLLVGSNNVGKSTICEALDLVLSPDRLNRNPAIDEFDFYNARYWQPPIDPATEGSVIPLRIEVVLIEPSDAVHAKCGSHLEFWHTAEQRLLGEGEVDLVMEPTSVPCLRLETIGTYDPEEDEFVAKTYFAHSPDTPDGEEKRIVPRNIKREFGFLYLRALRTGSRALSLERGSLLDVILRTKGVRTTLWESTIAKLRALDVEQDANEISPILRDIERRLGRYIALESAGQATSLHVSELTRDHLRKTMAFFLALRPDQDRVPFSHAGTGTLNTLVLALLSFIADLKPENVIFAMEEPEIAVPPPTQRRIAEYLLTKTTQSFVTSHSPFVIERFNPAQIMILSCEAGQVSSTRVSEASSLTDREFRRFARWGLCECMLGKAAIVVEGLTEFHALPVAAARMESNEPEVTGGHALDILGATFFNADSESNMPKFGQFFKSLGLKTFGFYDQPNSKRTDKQTQALAESYDFQLEHPCKGIETLVTTEMPVSVLWAFLAELRSSPDGSSLGIPEAQPEEPDVRTLAAAVLRSGKGAGWIADLFDACPYEALPPTVMGFLREVYAYLPKPGEMAGPADAEVSLDPSQIVEAEMAAVMAQAASGSVEASEPDPG